MDRRTFADRDDPFLLHGQDHDRSESGGPEGKPDLIVVGHQWWWEVRYPLADGTEADHRQ